MKLQIVFGNTYFIKGGTNTGVYLFENKNATVKKVSKETENGAKEYVYLDLLDENGNIKTSIPLKEPKKEEQKNNNK